MEYLSSRGNTPRVSAAEAIKMGMAPDGGLFVPESIPRLSAATLEEMATLSYQNRAALLFKLFLTDFSREEIESCVNGAYNSKTFDHPGIAPLHKLQEGIFVLELWHGPTSAFKDMALQALPYLLTISTRKTSETGETVILVATSGDTGKAALEGFKDVPGTRIIVFFPQDGVSEVQKRQMVTQEGKNVCVAAVQGNFDDAQNGVKRIFASREIIRLLGEHDYKMSSANSINWGRLLPQVVYYVSSYVDLCSAGQIAPGQAVNIVVPTGNFGNILAAFYATKMGVPVNRLICAANANNVLTDFINSGVYDRNRKFEKTLSPSMDILISSNLERLLFELTDHDDARVSYWMEELRNTGRYEIEKSTHQAIQKIFWSDFSTDEATLARIRTTWQEYGYLVDTHTAVALDVYARYRRSTGDQTPVIIASTASPFKFGSAVATAVMAPETIVGRNEFDILRILSQETGQTIPAGIATLEEKPIRHQTVTAARQMEATVLSFLGI